jgi:hypothetical protein
MEAKDLVIGNYYEDHEGDIVRYEGTDYAGEVSYLIVYSTRIEYKKNFTTNYNDWYAQYYLARLKPAHNYQAKVEIDQALEED